MLHITIKEYINYEETEILSLYRSVGWGAYYDQPGLLREAFAHSLCVFGAYTGERLVGLARVVGDGITIVFLQDILVAPQFQRKGIGRQLIAQVLNRYRHVRQLHLLTDDLPQTVGFYKAVGFTPVEQIHAQAFTRVRYL